MPKWLKPAPSHSKPHFKFRSIFKNNSNKCVRRTIVRQPVFSSVKTYRMLDIFDVTILVFSNLLRFLVTRLLAAVCENMERGEPQVVSFAMSWFWKPAGLYEYLCPPEEMFGREVYTQRHGEHKKTHEPACNLAKPQNYITSRRDTKQNPVHMT